MYLSRVIQTKISLPKLTYSDIIKFLKKITFICGEDELSAFETKQSRDSVGPRFISGDRVTRANLIDNQVSMCQ